MKEILKIVLALIKDSQGKLDIRKLIGAMGFLTFITGSMIVMIFSIWYDVKTNYQFILGGLTICGGVLGVGSQLKPFKKQNNGRL